MSTYPRDVRIVESSNGFNHWFPVGTIVTLKNDDGDFGQWLAFEASGPNANGRIINNSITQCDFEELTPDVKLTPVPKPAEPRVKYLYSVQNADGTIICNVRDREFARDVKATYGGKKEGIIIMAYAPTKEIR